MTIRTTALLLAAALTAGCTARDFFGYRDDAPLHAVARPDGYPSAAFGARIAPTFFHDDASFGDFAAVSAGRGTPTVFYRLSANGDLVDVDGVFDEYLTEDTAAAEAAGSGAALAGLPTWAIREDGEPTPITGCVAIGESAAANVHLYCVEGDRELDVEGEETGEDDPAGFGRALAAIRPTAGATWLLAAAADRFVTVFATESGLDRSAPLYPAVGGDADAPIGAIAGGALADGRFFVAAATGGEAEGVPPRVHLFLEDAPASPEATEVACLAVDEAGFGGVMTAGDLDRDGDDELIVSAGPVDGRVDAVYVYGITELAAAGTTCDDPAPSPLAVAEPGGGPLDVVCEPGAACQFGAALAVGDIATDDGGPELIVGAPGARVDGNAAAGAVYVYRGAELVAAGNAAVAGRLADSSPEKNKRFGGGVAAAAMAGRQELLVGAIGEGKMFVAYCTGVGADIEQGADVTRDAAGKLVSTRCRPR